MNYFELIKPLLYKMPAEMAHNLVIYLLKYNVLPKEKNTHYDNLKIKVFGHNFSHPIGLAAGFDKNAEAIRGLFAQNFSFIEAGTVTIRPQIGNAKPRIFRLEEDEAIVNRLGFNNKGLSYVLNQVKKVKNKGFFGINIGKNKDTDIERAIEDYLPLISAFSPYVSYITLNISSPNTPGLRDLQNHDSLQKLLSLVMSCKKELKDKSVPILVKIAPDLTIKELEGIVENILHYEIDGLIISNSTISRPDSLLSDFAQELGGLSGRPLFNRSTDILQKTYAMTKGKVPLIGVGGVFSGKDAYDKILSGASLIQIYSALIYQGFSAVERIKKELTNLLQQDGYKNISEAVGQGIK